KRPDLAIGSAVVGNPEFSSAAREHRQTAIAEHFVVRREPQDFGQRLGLRSAPYLAIGVLTVMHLPKRHRIVKQPELVLPFENYDETASHAFQGNDQILDRADSS